MISENVYFLFSKKRPIKSSAWNVSVAGRRCKVLTHFWPPGFWWNPFSCVSCLTGGGQHLPRPFNTGERATFVEIMSRLIIIRNLMVCLANQTSQGKLVPIGIPCSLRSPPVLCQAIWGFEADLVFRCPPGLSSCALLRCLSNQQTCPATVKEIQSSEKALIHHTSLAACHLNAKYFHCIFKSKQEKKWARWTSLWKG